ncbi:hypothetical protein Fmac_016928 [Flemingia macrophylla]|uniref:Cytochrome P450 n=1 Tax=Flemingia macrophylla TaxID=520843 RepID=A0ABD1MIS1_9FABA
MALPIYAAIFLFSILYMFNRRRSCKHPILRDYPVVGMLPPVLLNLCRIRDYATEVTCDSLNVQHMLLKNFDNYVKGPLFRQIFETFGDGVGVADAETWKYCKTTSSFSSSKKGTKLLLNRSFRTRRFGFDNICSIVAGRDPMCLSMDFPEVVIERAFNESEESIFYRHTVPMTVWKREELRKCSKEEMDELPFDLITASITSENCGTMERSGITSCLTWILVSSAHPLVKVKIVDEIKVNFPNNNMVLGMEEMKKLVYLHGALYETLRLFPPVPFERKQAIKADTLPSGHRVHPNAMIMVSLYAMGRSKEIWEKDCLEFKPERWISNKREVVYVPSYKFIAFNTGPRMCLGKNTAMIQMKILVSSFLTTIASNWWKVMLLLQIIRSSFSRKLV